MIKDQRQYNEPKVIFSTNGTETTEHSQAKIKNKKSKHRPDTLNKIDSKYPIDLKVKHKTYNS